MTDLGSPFWQNVLLYAAGVFLLWEIYAGWRRGLIRAGLHFGAFVASGLLAVLIGKAVVSIVGVVLPGVALLAGVLTGVAVLLTVLAICLFLGALLFKRTSQQPPGPLRWIFGAGGALFGLLTGLFLLWGAISIIRTGGAIAKSSGKAPILAVLKDSLEMGPVGKAVDSIDIMPDDAYEKLTLVSRLSEKPEAMAHFIEDPGVRKILAHPRMQALLQDRQVIQAIENGDYFALLTNKTLMQAATDPGLQKMVVDLDLEKALNYALSDKQNPAPKKSKP